MVELTKIVKALESDSMVASYYDRETDSIVEGISNIIDSEDIHSSDDDYVVDVRRYVIIEPDEFFENEVMNSFIETLDDPTLVSKLECAANRRGASRHFLNTVFAARLDKEWFEFRNSRYKAEARHICEAFGIPYE